MSRAHVHVGEVAGRDTVVHRLDPRVKIVGLIGLAVVSATTPLAAWWAFAAYAGMLVGLAATARLPVGLVLRRMAVEIPFLVTAAALILAVPGGAPRGWTLAAKATIGVLAMVVLSATTPFPSLLNGFARLRAPAVLVMIVSFMWRYAFVLAEEVRRMKIARESRGHDPRWLWQAGPIARGGGALFVRSLERGERVHVAMLSRGYTGAAPARTPALVLGPLDAVFCAGMAMALAAIRLALV